MPVNLPTGATPGTPERSCKCFRWALQAAGPQPLSQPFGARPRAPGGYGLTRTVPGASRHALTMPLLVYEPQPPSQSAAGRWQLRPPTHQWLPEQEAGTAPLALGRPGPCPSKLVSRSRGKGRLTGLGQGLRPLRRRNGEIKCSREARKAKCLQDVGQPAPRPPDAVGAASLASPSLG